MFTTDEQFVFRMQVDVHAAWKRGEITNTLRSTLLTALDDVQESL